MDNLQRQVSAQQYKYADVKQKLDALKAEEIKLEFDTKQCDENIFSLNKEFQELIANIPKANNRLKIAEKTLAFERVSKIFNVFFA